MILNLHWSMRLPFAMIYYMNSWWDPWPQIHMDRFDIWTVAEHNSRLSVACNDTGSSIISPHWKRSKTPQLHCTTSIVIDIIVVQPSTLWVFSPVAFCIVCVFVSQVQPATMMLMFCMKSINYDHFIGWLHHSIRVIVIQLHKCILEITIYHSVYESALSNYINGRA